MGDERTAAGAVTSAPFGLRQLIISTLEHDGLEFMSTAHEGADGPSKSYIPRKCHRTTIFMASACSEPASRFCVTPNTCHNGVNNRSYPESVLRTAECTEPLLDSGGVIVYSPSLKRGELVHLV